MVLPVGTGVYLIPTVMFLVTSHCGSLVYIIYTCHQLFPSGSVWLHFFGGRYIFMLYSSGIFPPIYIGSSVFPCPSIASPTVFLYTSEAHGGSKEANMWLQPLFR